MANMLFANNANTTLASSLTNSATSMSVTSASAFPSPTGSQYFYCTLADAATQQTIEIVKVTAVSGTTFTIVRGQDGTSGTAFNSGDVVSLRLVRASLNDFPKLDENNTFTYAPTFNTALAVGSGGTGVTASSGANSVVLRDSNQNVYANNFIPNTTFTVASSTPVNLTVASSQYQVVTGSVTSQTINMPDATTLTVGDTYYFNNNITYSSVQINAHDGSTSLLALQAGGAAHLILLSNSTSNGTWDIHSYVPSTVSWGTATLNFNSSSSISGPVSWQGNVISATYGGTGEAGTLTGILYGNGTSPHTVATTAQLLSGIGTLPVANGGTALTSFTSNGVLYASSSSVLATGSVLTFDGTLLKLSKPSPSGNIFQIDNNSTYGIVVNSSTQVGINNSSPISPLDVRVSSGEVARFALASSSSNLVNIIIGKTTLTTEGLSLQYDGSTGNSIINSIYSGGSLIFKSANTQAMQIAASGGVSIGNTTDPGAGNLRFATAGTNGIYFGSSARLDDYQQGTWTPKLSDGTNTVNLTGGYYIKVGKLVTIFVNSYNTSMAGLSTSANLFINNLPFTPTQDSAVAWNPTLYVAAQFFNMYLSAVNNKIYVYRNSSTIDYTGVPLVVFGSPSNMSWFFSMSYTA